MREAGHRPGELLRRLMARPDEIMLELGAGGELLVARVRAVISLLILALPLVAAAGGSASQEVIIGLAAAIVVNVMAQLWLALARGRRRRPWLPFATATYDVTITTGALVALAFYDPVAALNSMIVWCFYAVSITLTALRNDGRLAIYAGVLSIAQYAAVIWFVFATASSPESLVSVDYGVASISAQVQRLILLLIITVITATIVYRMQRLVDMSGHDGLTGLPNRAWLLQQLPRVFSANRSAGTSLTLAMIDIDDFRRINDDIGHAGGDRVIRHFAAALSEMTLDNELVARIGGQEFVMLLHGPIGGAWERLDRLRRSVAEQRFLPERGNEALHLTFSAGLAAWPQDGGTTSALLKVADVRLKQAKRDGRNRLVAREV